MTDSRKARRQRTFKGGSISLSTGILDCTVRNLSETGSLIELQNPAMTPDTFTLIIKPELLRRSCQVAWRDGRRIGVQFK
jgi:hypothetical protein